MRIYLVTPRVPPTRCGVGDYTSQVARFLVHNGAQVTLLTGTDQRARREEIFTVRPELPNWGPQGALELFRALRRERPDLVILQWVPHLYGRFGVNLSIPLALLALCLSGVPVQTMVHEPWVDMRSPSSVVFGALHRLALFILSLASRRLTVSIQAWTRLLQWHFPWRARSIEWVPVGSNIDRVPLSEVARKALRQEWDIPEDVTLLALFSPFGSGKDGRFIQLVWRNLKVRHEKVYLIVIGATAEEAKVRLPELVGDERCRFSGYLSPAGVSHWLQAADIFLAPFVDGISTRRTSAIAAMAHGLPMVATRGFLTDPAVFEPSPILLAGNDAREIGDAVYKLVADRTKRVALGEETLGFFNRHFSWKAIVPRLLGTELWSRCQAEAQANEPVGVASAARK